jgi:hypothetical protein
MEPEGSISVYTEGEYGVYSEPNETSPYAPIQFSRDPCFSTKLVGLKKKKS